MSPKKRTKEENRRIGKLSKNKGKRREREWVSFLIDHGCLTAQRTSQYNGKEGLADVIAPHDLGAFHQEVKGEEQLNVWKALTQASFDSLKEHGAIPIVAHRKNGTGWMVTMHAGDWVRLAKDFGMLMLVGEGDYEDEAGDACGNAG